MQFVNISRDALGRSGIEGTLTSNAGADGNDLTEMLTGRLEDFLAAEGEAYVFVLQLVADGEPLIAKTLHKHLRQRAVTLTSVQEEICPFEHYEAAYLQRFAPEAAAIDEWARDLRARLGSELGVQHQIVRIPPRGPSSTTWSIVDNLASEYGAGFSYLAAAGTMTAGRIVRGELPNEKGRTSLPFPSDS